MKTIATILLCCMSVMSVYSQSDSLPRIADRLMDYYQKVPMEKIHVHTDRSSYASGDTIWFRAYLVVAFNRELINSSSS